MTQSQVLSFTSGFPPAEKMTNFIVSIDYRKLYHDFMNGVTIACAFIAAIATVISQKWNEYYCTERLQLVAINTYEWLKTVAVPNTKKFASSVYQAGVKTREIYEVINSPLFITL
jgi:hypothetical protein